MEVDESPFHYLHPFPAHLRNPPIHVLATTPGERRMARVQPVQKYIRQASRIRKESTFPSHYHYFGRSEVCYQQCRPGLYTGVSKTKNDLSPTTSNLPAVAVP